MTYVRHETIIGDRQCLTMGDPEARFILFQAVDEHDAEGLEEQCAALAERVGEKPFLLCAFRVRDWSRELTPWSLPEGQALRGNTFGDGAAKTLECVENALIPAILEARNRNDTPFLLLGGYSLAGLFALWAGYSSTAFDGIAGVSPSVWYPGWDAYTAAHRMNAECVYLSLGDREEKSRGMMGRVGDGIRGQYAALSAQKGLRCTLEWNPGNHFKDAPLRTAKGFAWLMKQLITEGDGHD